MINQPSSNINNFIHTELNARMGRAHPAENKRERPFMTEATPVAIEDVESDTAGENISVKNAVIRILCIPGLAFTSFIAWDYTPYYIVVLAPAVFYLIVTAFTLYCPLTALWDYLTNSSGGNEVSAMLKGNKPDDEL